MVPPPSAPAHRAVVHVGAPKTGTTYLQQVMWRHRELLAEAGYLLPGPNARAMFHAAVELRGTADKWGLPVEDLAGTWHRLCQQAQGHAGTTIMSHEVLAAATPEQVAGALAELEGLEVHVVLTARDLARQVISDWQEQVKNGSTSSFDAFARRTVRQLRDGKFESLFWRQQHLVGVLSRWGASLPAEQVHVVVAPPPGAAPDVLWNRFAEATDLDGLVEDPTTGRGKASNQTLGVAQVDLLVRVNEALDGRLEGLRYSHVVKRFFAQTLLSGQPAERPVCPPELRQELHALSEQWVGEVADRGWRVHGDLADLLPGATASDGSAPGDVDLAEEVAAAAAAIADLLVEVADLRQRARRGPLPVPAPAGRLRRYARRLLRRPL